MWILPNQLIQSHSLKVTEELSEALSLLENELDQSLLVRSKPMPSRTLSQRWKKGHWIRTLFGRMPKPSQASNFLEKWISSQEDSHVSHSVQQVEEKPTKIQDICGLLALEPSISSDLKEFCLKMSKDLLAQSSVAMGGATQKGHQYCSMSAESWKDEVTKQRGEYSQRVKQVHHIREKEFSSSDNWATPRQCSAMAAKITPENSLNPDRFPNLETMVGKEAFNGLQNQDNNKEQWKSLELNASWVEQLMGLTTGSTDLGYWGME